MRKKKKDTGRKAAVCEGVALRKVTKGCAACLFFMPVERHASSEKKECVALRGR